jgi:hypothetical protein
MTRFPSSSSIQSPFRISATFTLRPRLRTANRANRENMQLPGIHLMRPSTNEASLLDPIEETGCQLLNDAVLLCYAETKDWRKCRKEVEAFKRCMGAYELANKGVK